MSAHAEIHDPNEIGPIGVCLRCFVRESEDYAFCLNCGRKQSPFDASFYPADGACHLHPQKEAIGYCCLCAHPVCKDCLEREGYSIAAPGPRYYCKACVERSREIEARYFAELKASGCCGKHTGVPAIAFCTDCGLPLCRSCAYFKVSGLFRRKRGEGPFCLVCFRMKTLGSGRRRWMLADELRY